MTRDERIEAALATVSSFEQKANERAGTHSGDTEVMVILRDEVLALRAQVERQGEVAHRAIASLPAQQEGGGYIVEHFDDVGNYIGSENISEAEIIQGLLSALAQIESEEVLALRGQVERQWISVDERLPKDNLKALLHTKYDYIGIAKRVYDPDLGHHIWWDDATDELIEEGWITHWMPLPEPPLAQIESEEVGQ